MSERRYDPTADEWVTFATQRQDRTYQPPADQCPLCPTHDPAHWEFAPAHRSADKIKYVAGSEMMGGAYMTDVAPEAAAERLRNAVG